MRAAKMNTAAAEKRIRAFALLQKITVAETDICFF